MTWTKLGDEFADDPRLLSVPRGVRLLHLEALLWCNRHNTDGHLPAAALARLTDQRRPRDAAAQLVIAGLWEQSTAPADGWLLVGFLDDQPSKEDVLRSRDAARVRQQRSRQHKVGDHSLCEKWYCKAANPTVPAGQENLSRRDSRVTNASVTLPRPDPTRTYGKGEGKGRADQRLPALPPVARSARPPANYIAPSEVVLGDWKQLPK